MRDTVDTRVVRMEFDNKQFEKNIKKTSQSLENLKQNLDFDGLGDGLDKVKVKISALDIVVTTFVANISNKLINAVTNLVKSLSIDNVSSGFNKYGEKTISVATMMAQKIRIAGEVIDDLGEKTKVVDEQLALLNWFSDETSYSFNDMVSSVGKFTAAGQDLDVSVKAMEGIATWAALSGQNAQTASRAMYQLAQAMGKGKIQKIDWMSIQNANMDTEEFRETVLKTASDLGELTKEGEQFVTKTGKKFTQAQFTELLSEGWFTSDVLVKSLGKYSAAIDDIYEISQREGLLASEVVEKYGDTLDEFGVKAFKAAQEARTFSDVLNAIKDAVSSKWMATFESIFGNKEEAVKLWSDLANELYDVFAEGGNFRNEILDVWKSLGGRDDLFARGGDNQGAFWNLYDAIISVRDLIKSAWNTVFPLTEMEEYSAQVEDIGNKVKSITTKIREFTERLKLSEAASSRLSKIFQGLFNILKIGAGVIKSIAFILDPIIDTAKRLINDVLDQFAYYGNNLVTIGSKFEYIIVKIRDLVITLLDSLNPQGILSSVFDFAKKIFKIIYDYKPITRLVNHVKTFIQALQETANFKSNLSNFFGMFKSGIELVSKILSQIFAVVIKLFPVVSKIINVLFKGAGFLIGIISKVLSYIGEIFTKIFEFISQSNLLETIENTIVEFLKNVYSFLKPLINIIIKLALVIGDFVKKILISIPDSLKNISKAMKNSGIINTLGSILSSIIDIISNFIRGAGNASGNILSSLGQAFQQFFKGFITFIKSMIPVLQIAMRALGKMLEIIGELINKIANTILNIMSGKGATLGKIVRIVIILAVVLTLAKIIYDLFFSIKQWVAPIRYLLESISDVCDAIVVKLKSKIIQDMAKAIMKMAISLALIASIPESELIKALAAVILIYTIILGMMHALSDIIKGKTIKTIQKIRTVSMAMSTMVTNLIKIAIVLALLSRVQEDKLWTALKVSMAVMAFIIGIMQYSVKKFTPKKIERLKAILVTISKMIGILFGVAIALRILAVASGTNVLAATASIMIMMTFITLLLNKLSKFTESKLKKANLGIKALNKVIASLLLVAIALKILASGASSEGDFIGAAAGLSLAIYSLFGVMLLVQKFIKKNKAETFALFEKALIRFGNAMILMAIAIRILSNSNNASMFSAVAALSLMVYAMIGVLVLIQKFVKKNSVATFAAFSYALIPFASSMLLMAGVVALLGAISAAKVWNSIAAMAAFSILMLSIVKFAELIRFTAILNFAAFSIALIPFMVAIELLAGVLATLATIKNGKIWHGIAAIAGFIALVALSIKLIGLYGSFKFGVFSISLLKFAAGMSIIAGIIVLLGNMEPEKEKRGRKAIQRFLTLMALSIKLVGLLSVFKFGIFATSLILFGSAMTIMSGVITILGNMKTGNLWKAIGAIIVFTSAILALSALSGVLHAGTSMIGLAIGMTAFSLAMIPFAMALSTLGNIPIKQLAIGLLTIAGSLAVLLAISIIAKPIVTTMLAISAALLMAGVGMLAMGVGLVALSAGITALATTFAIAVEAIHTIILTLVDIILDVLFEVIGTVVTRISDLLPYVFDIVYTILDGIITLVGEKGPALVEMIVSLLDGVLRAISDHGESIFESIFTIINIVLNKLLDNIDNIVDKLIQILIKVIEKLTEWIPELTKKVLTFVITAIQELFDNIGPLIDVIVDNVFDFVAKVIVAISKKAVALAGMIAKVILIVLAAAIKIVIASLGTLGKLITIFVYGLLMVLWESIKGLAYVVKAIIQTIVKDAIKLLFDTITWAIPTLGLIGSLIVRAIMVGVLDLLSNSFKWVLEVIDFLFGSDLVKKLENSIGSLSNTIQESAKKDIDAMAGGLDSIVLEVNNASKGINKVVSDTSKMASTAVQDGVDSIGKSVTKSMKDLNISLSDFAEDAGSNIISGMREGANSEDANLLGEELGLSLTKGFKETTKINSPSKVFAEFGGYLLSGLNLGINKSKESTVDTMGEVISKSLALANDIINDQTDNDLTIRVGMDISSVEAESRRIQDIMSGVNNPSVTAAGVNADYNSRAMSKKNYSKNINNAQPSTTNNSNDVTYNNTFNITSTDPSESAEEIDRILQQQAMRRKLAHGI